MDGALLAYLFSALLIGVACVGLIVLWTLRRADEQSRAFLFFYAALSVLVIGRLLVVFMDAVFVGTQVRALTVYLESFVGRYGVMLALPLLAHRLFRVGRGQDRIVIAIVGAAALLQHVTEFGLRGRLDEAGDVFEDVLFAGFIAYTLALGIRRLAATGGYRSFAVRLLTLIGLGLPGIAFDLFLSDVTPWRFYPLWYCILSVVLTHALYASAPRIWPAAPPDRWGLSARELEVATLAARGLGNREIGARLTISPNTVKTHLRSIFEKSGVRTRIELSATLSAPPDDAGTPRITI